MAPVFGELDTDMAVRRHVSAMELLLSACLCLHRIARLRMVGAD